MHMNVHETGNVMQKLADIINRVHCADCLEFMRELPDECVDCVITDPPYGMGLDEWDTQIDTERFFNECDRLLNKEGFIAFFGQMPYMLRFCNSASLRFQYLEHISWIKRFCSPSKRLSRSHESVLIYSKGHSHFHAVSGRYSDVKVEGIYHDVVSIESIKRYIESLHGQLLGTTTGYMSRSQKTQSTYRRFKGQRSERARAPQYVNFTNVWSFLPQQLKEKNCGYLHPTEKPIGVMTRLVEMLSAQGSVILDPFLGSGTTAVAAKQLGRNFIGVEINPEYCKIAEERLKQEVLPFNKPAAPESQEPLFGESQS